MAAIFRKLLGMPNVSILSLKACLGKAHIILYIHSHVYGLPQLLAVLVP